MMIFPSSAAFREPPSMSLSTTSRCASSCSTGSASSSLRYEITTFFFRVVGSTINRMVTSATFLVPRKQMRKRLAIEHLPLEQQIAQRDHQFSLILQNLRG